MRTSALIPWLVVETLEAALGNHYDHRSETCGEAVHVVFLARTMRKMLRSQALRCAILVTILPMLIIAPGQAGMFLMHRHCDESTHLHRFHGTDLDDWQHDHARQHPCEGPEHHKSLKVDTAVADADCDHDTPILILPFIKEHLSRPARSGGSVVLALSLAVFAAPAGFPAAPEHAQSGEPPPSNGPQADLARLCATAALLLRNHALLL